ncbi:hypothetical protein Pcinc_019526 [Petrolisthes cinctipes]|uniref:Uncharacterized protein n=1 Tax=Petrolisthes cinctipes TaxID=88211 RepID=A0AAE1KL23_PETCI|nr:hypothetical protein Pcinc_032137 [Petrolisthes cinctipes]KAK3875618.1 hypothetical protein Pcinc_019526 [Petrolisthes cinctipes]
MTVQLMSENEGMSDVHKFTLVTKNNNLTSDQRQLFDLVRAAGFTLHPQIFKIIMDLLNLHVPPHALVTLLKEVSGKIFGIGSA